MPQTRKPRTRKQQVKVEHEPRELLDWTKLRDEIRAEWDKRRRPIAVFPDKQSKLKWLAEGARTGTTPPLPEGAYYEMPGK